MANPDPKDLVERLSKSSRESYREEEHKKLTSLYPEEIIRPQLEKILIDFPEIRTDFLKKGITSSILGALYAFHDRQLHPFADEHYTVFSRIHSDITQVYGEYGNLINDPEIWLFETFDYGINQVYYLDWQLYLSKMCY
ncbi:MAG: hypothetical protein K8R21_03240 [Leptospira sp.]|nr:hypothetical protein [Leptospira sp.]